MSTGTETGRGSINILNRARRDSVFVPWHYVLAGAAVSGTLACRTSYTLAKPLVERRGESGVALFLIDDATRSREPRDTRRLPDNAPEASQQTSYKSRRRLRCDQLSPRGVREAIKGREEPRARRSSRPDSR
jgi:hypothetical protein